jgi:hypothetical protein
MDLIKLQYFKKLEVIGELETKITNKLSADCEMDPRELFGNMDKRLDYALDKGVINQEQYKQINDCMKVRRGLINHDYDYLIPDHIEELDNIVNNAVKYVKAINDGIKLENKGLKGFFKALKNLKEKDVLILIIKQFLKDK